MISQRVTPKDQTSSLVAQSEILPVRRDKEMLLQQSFEKTRLPLGSRTISYLFLIEARGSQALEQHIALFQLVAGHDL